MIKTKKLTYLLFNLPMIIIFIIVLLYPIIVAIKLSFFNTKLLMPAGTDTFIGLSNYIKLFGNIKFWQSLRVTIIYTIWVVAGSFIIGLIIAMFLNPIFQGRSIARMLMILPWAVPEVATIMIWRWMLDYQYGVVNFFAKLLGLINEPLGWLTNPELAIISVIVVTIWKQFPLATVILLAGLQCVPIDLYEAARMDGANFVQEFRFITMPSLKPISFVLILLLTIYSFKRTTLIFLMTGGGPSRATEVLSIKTYLEVFKNFKIGYGSAIGIIMLLILSIFSFLYFIVSSKQSK